VGRGKGRKEEEKEKEGKGSSENYYLFADPAQKEGKERKEVRKDDIFNDCEHSGKEREGEKTLGKKEGERARFPMPLMRIADVKERGRERET